MCIEPSELPLIGCLTELTWNPRFKSNMLTPRTNLLIFWPKEVSREMSGVTSCVCWKQKKKKKYNEKKRKKKRKMKKREEKSKTIPLQFFLTKTRKNLRIWKNRKNNIFKKKKIKKIWETKKRGLQGVPPETARKMFVSKKNVTRNRAAIEAQKWKNKLNPEPQRSHSALQAS